MGTHDSHELHWEDHDIPWGYHGVTMGSMETHGAPWYRHGAPWVFPLGYEGAAHGNPMIPWVTNENP